MSRLTVLLASHQTLPNTWLPELVIALAVVIVTVVLGVWMWERALFNENQAVGRVARTFVLVGVVSLIFAALLAVFPINTNNGLTHCGTAFFPEGEFCGDARRSIQLTSLVAGGLGTTLLAVAMAVSPRRYD